VKAGFIPRVYTVDTGRLFPETIALFDAVEKKYGLKIERYYPDPAELKTMIEENGEYLFFDSKEKQELCCRVRKSPTQRTCVADIGRVGDGIDGGAVHRSTPENAPGGNYRARGRREESARF
jgi:3'-phosphoadenosine 5'-phosphosulfate sulfotransferase (PAPS reductase)/FAD synthetase